jgi:hypothetical protein
VDEHLRYRSARCALGPHHHRQLLRDREAFTHVGTITRRRQRTYHFYDDVVVARINDPSCITSIGDVPALDESTAGEGDACACTPTPPTN